MMCIFSRRAAKSMTPTFATYSARLGEDKRLSAEQERALAEAVARGDSKARDQLVRSNLGLVFTIARDYFGRGLDLDDLVGEGNLGLIRAAEDFDPRFGTRFSTYAAHWIKQAILHALITTTATIRLPAHMVTLLSKWRKAERALTRVLGQSPTFDQVAVSLGLSGAKRVMVESAMKAGRLRLEGGDDEDRSPHEAGDHREGPDAPVERTDMTEGLRERMAGCLDAREREIIALRFGLGGGEPLTLREVGRRVGFTREWVRKIEGHAIGKLRVDMCAQA
jgi:RNA polymerase primary sigma factor